MVRTLNARLHQTPPDINEKLWRVANRRVVPSIAAGLTGPSEIIVQGHAGYYCGGMNKEAAINRARPRRDRRRREHDEWLGSTSPTTPRNRPAPRGAAAC
jgi:hypothetical protein